MATQRLGDVPAPERITDYTRARLCAEWHALDNERLKLQAAALAKRKRQDEIERDLGGQALLDGTGVVDLPRWQFGYELVAGFFSYRDELVKEIGLDELNTRKAAVPQKRDFFLRDKGPARPAAKTKASPRARHKRAA